MLPEHIYDLLVDHDGCWVWRQSLTRLGYAMVALNVRKRSVHHLVWEDMRGPIPPGLEMDHRCRNRACANPAHLEPVTHAENMRRAVHSRAFRYWTECARGHALTPDNIGAQPSKPNSLYCIACKRLTANTSRD